MSRYFLTLSFYGKNYHGWQVQENAETVQQYINKAVSLLLSDNIECTGCGRTDSGVSALNFVAHFDTNVDLKNPEVEKKFLHSINGILPKDISVQSIKLVTKTAHARFSAISRTYKYYICNHKNPFINRFSYFLNEFPDINIMNSAESLLLNTSDFTSFAKLHSNTKNNICKIQTASWNYENLLNFKDLQAQLVFTITADRFLRNMVRSIVGTLIDLGKNKISIEDLKHIIDSKNRCKAGYSVPAKALFLTNIEYPQEIFI